jgi:membrane-associated phospholipid phosphatase
MALSYSVFFILYSVTMVVGIFASLLINIGWKDISWRKALASLRYNAIYIILIAVFPLFIQGQDLLEAHFTDAGDTTREVVYTNWIFSLAGGSIVVLQDRLDYRILKDFFMIIYAWLFTFLIYFAPVLLLARDDRVNLRRYAIAMMLNYVVLVPFYALFPVTVSGSHPASGVTPELYLDTHWGKMCTSVDPLNNDFPSGHTSLAVTTLLIFWFGGATYKKFARFLAWATGAIIFAVLYLGVHWPADVLAGFFLAVFAYTLSGTEKIQMTIDRYVRGLTQRILGPEKHEKSSSVPPPP